jgi:hypothetical protein
MIVTKENLAEVLQHLYDSEIDVHIGWLWDGGVDYSLENSPNSLLVTPETIKSTGERNIVKAVQIIVDDVIEKFPKSGFVKWATNKQKQPFSKLEEVILDKLVYVGENIPETIVNDKFTKFVLLGTPSQFIRDIKD